MRLSVLLSCFGKRLTLVIQSEHFTPWYVLCPASLITTGGGWVLQGWVEVFGGGGNRRRHFDLRIKGPKADEALTDRLDSSSRVLFVPGCHHEERLAVWAAWGAEVGAGWGWGPWRGGGLGEGKGKLK